MREGFIGRFCGELSGGVGESGQGFSVIWGCGDALGRGEVSSFDEF